MKLIKNLLAAVALFVAVSASAQQQQLLTSLTANTASNLLAKAYIIDNFIVINSTTNIATLKFYDSSTTSTTMVQAAYTSYSSYATNFSTVFTNEANVLVTNSFTGIYTAPTSNTVATNTRPAIYTLIVPASSTLTKDVRLQVMRGLTVVPNQTTTLLTTYRLP